MKESERLVIQGKCIQKLYSSSQQEKTFTVEQVKDTIPLIDNLIDFLKVLFLFLARLSDRLISSYSATFDFFLAFLKLFFTFSRHLLAFERKVS